jgi:hypothetical protein
MKYRTLKNGEKVAEAPERVPMTIDSKCPRKWAFIDMETGDIWVHKSRRPNGDKRPYTFYVADRKALRIVKDIIWDILHHETVRFRR